MRRALVAPAIAVASLVATEASADEVVAEPLPVMASVEIVRGFRNVAPRAAGAIAEEEELEESDPRETQGLSVVADAEIRVSRHFRLGARVPVSAASFLFSARDEDDAASVGNFELAPQYTTDLRKGLRFACELGVAFPTATGDEFGEGAESRRHAYANLASARFRGFRDNALFASHRLGFVPMTVLELRSDDVEVDGFVKLEVLERAGGAAPSEALGRVNASAVESVFGGRVETGRRLSPYVHLGMQSWLAYTLVGEVKHPERAGVQPSAPLQIVVEPQVAMTSGHFRSMLGMLVPVGGPLGDWHYLAARFAVSLEM
ncbi:MAG: hypothetical protein KF819_15055 [Labilithrix sp.]|nr:hypothetical protein [Labilithrix sp.]